MFSGDTFSIVTSVFGFVSGHWSSVDGIQSQQDDQANNQSGFIPAKKYQKSLSSDDFTPFQKLTCLISRPQQLNDNNVGNGYYRQYIFPFEEKR